MKKIIALLLSLVLVVSLAACGGQKKDDPKPQEEAKKASVTVTVVHKDGTSKDFTYETDAEYLGALLVNEGLVSGKDGQYGLMITRVDGEDAVYETDGAYWALYEGEEYAMQGVDKTPIKDGATYKLVYTVG